MHRLSNDDFQTTVVTTADNESDESSQPDENILCIVPAPLTTSVRQYTLDSEVIDDILKTFESHASK